MWPKRFSIAPSTENSGDDIPKAFVPAKVRKIGHILHQPRREVRLASFTTSGANNKTKNTHRLSQKTGWAAPTTCNPTYQSESKERECAGFRADFEHLVERLYQALGYDTWLTPPIKDGGRDVIAERRDPSRRERVLVECKLKTAPVPVDTVRNLLGVVADEKATKCVLVTNNIFTTGDKSAAEFVDRNPNLEMIAGDQLVRLLNANLGIKWPQQIHRLIQESRGGLEIPRVRKTYQFRWCNVAAVLRKEVSS